MLLLLLGLLWGTAVAQSVPGDIVFEREAGEKGVPAAVFPHWLHRVRFRCYVCHPQIFEMKKGANAITMEKIRGGEFCGRCHNGRTAFPVDFQSCSRCHKPPEEKKP
ncbi:MAG: c(7)-type cytochrome triheme domain-containing protein [Nitrospinota bacterium]